MKHVLAALLLVGAVWGNQAAQAADPEAVEAPVAAVVVESTDEALLVSGTAEVAEVAEEAVVAEDTQEASFDVMGILKQTEVIIGMITALIVAIISLIAMMKGKATASAAVSLLTEKIEKAKMITSQKATAANISEAVSKMAPRDESAVGALIHKFAKVAEKKVNA